MIELRVLSDMIEIALKAPAMSPQALLVSEGRSVDTWISDALASRKRCPNTVK
jgi:hypothetical protein